MGERDRDVVHLQGGGRFWVFVRYDKLPAKKGFTLILRALKELSQMVKNANENASTGSTAVCRIFTPAR